jgi:hypothetical protein
MKNQIARIVAVLAVPFAMNAAFADELTNADRLPQANGASASVEQVKAELADAQAKSRANFGYGFGQGSKIWVVDNTKVSRAQVKAELRQALAAGQVVYGEAQAPELAKTPARSQAAE